jgi:hypothetical protein
VNAGELTAAAEVLDLLSDVVRGIKVAHYNDEQFEDSIDRLSEAVVTLTGLARELRLDADYPELADLPEADFRKNAERLRKRLATPTKEAQ